MTANLWLEVGDHVSVEGRVQQVSHGRAKAVAHLMVDVCRGPLQNASKYLVGLYFACEPVMQRGLSFCATVAADMLSGQWWYLFCQLALTAQVVLVVRQEHKKG